MKNVKEWVKTHKREIIAGSVLVATAAYYIRQQSCAIDTLERELTGVARDKNTLMAAASEGPFEEAIATTTRKLNYRKDQLKYLRNARHKGGAQNEDAAAKTTALMNEINVLQERLIKFRDAQQLYGVSGMN